MDPKETTYTFEIKSDLAASPETVWRHSTCMSAVNLELKPWMRMTFPERFRILEPASIPLGERLFRSWILLFSFLPFERYEVTFQEFGPGHRFLERSPTISQHWWQHERTVEVASKGSRVTDRVTVWPRVAWLLPLSAWIAKAVFTHRHQKLRRLFPEQVA